MITYTEGGKGKVLNDLARKQFVVVLFVLEVVQTQRKPRPNFVCRRKKGLP